MTRPENFEFQEWWNQQRDKNNNTNHDLLLDTSSSSSNNDILTVQVTTPTSDPTVEKGRSRSARQLYWLCLLRFQQLFSFVFVVLIVASLPSDQGVFGSGSDLAVFGACGVLQRMAFQAAGWVGRGVGNAGVCVFELDLDSGELLGSAVAGVDECVYRAVLDSVG